ncbi:hypothetical protein H072_3976 [Dactylellina haptotyla CBS 200.50]|uniref:Uncharacterized protein n=1 Tax=Dactylellina haptotyla (strain CBS 200.50) TaxID=1284197 RepID=S8ALU0_DACHA|nr:hypothetical protein H072_3976 [Dactylellina haptotyla CBS 200.50]
MPCAGPYIPTKIHLTPQPNQSDAVQFFLRHGWTVSEAHFLRNRAHIQEEDIDLLVAYDEFPFPCRERDFYKELGKRLNAIWARQNTVQARITQLLASNRNPRPKTRIRPGRIDGPIGTR